VGVPPVVVEIQAEQATMTLVDTLLEACTRAVATTTCVQAGTAGELEQPAAVAIVTFVGPRTVQIQVGLREDRRWRVHELAFSPVDEQTEMWRAVGFATGTLVARASNREQPSETPPPAPPAQPPVTESRGKPKSLETPQPPAPPQARVSPAPIPKKPSPWTTIDIGATIGPGLGKGATRTGGLLRATLNHPTGILGTAALEESLGLGEHRGLETWWTTLGLGAGYAVRLGRVAVEGRGEAIAERLAVAAKLGASTQSGSRWVGGGRLGLGAAWLPMEAVGVVLGTSGYWLAGWTDATLRQVPVGTEPRLGYGCYLGLRLALR
jgi:hypothetical protein